MKNLPFTKYSRNGNPVACPICGSAKRTIISKYDRRFKILPHAKCGECALVRHEFMLSDEELAEYYSNSYRKDYQRVRTNPLIVFSTTIQIVIEKTIKGLVLAQLQSTSKRDTPKPSLD